MAHLNIDERRLEVKNMILNNYTRQDMKIIASKFNCSYNAIYMDIVFLSKKDNIPIWPSRRRKNEILKRDKNICQYCLNDSSELIVEHVIPYILGGNGEQYNLVAACNPCNLKKRSKVWIPNNINLILSINEDWGNKIIGMAVNNIINS